MPIRTLRTNVFQTLQQFRIPEDLSNLEELDGGRFTTQKANRIKIFIRSRRWRKSRPASSSTTALTASAAWSLTYEIDAYYLSEIACSTYRPPSNCSWTWVVVDNYDELHLIVLQRKGMWMWWNCCWMPKQTSRQCAITTDELYLVGLQWTDM